MYFVVGNNISEFKIHKIYEANNIYDSLFQKDMEKQLDISFA